MVQVLFSDTNYDHLAHSNLNETDDCYLISLSFWKTIVVLIVTRFLFEVNILSFILLNLLCGLFEGKQCVVMPHRFQSYNTNESLHCTSRTIILMKVHY